MRFFSKNISIDNSGHSCKSLCKKKMVKKLDQTAQNSDEVWPVV